MSTDASALRALQKPFKDAYRIDPATAVARVHAEGRWTDDGITCTVDSWAGPVRAGLHPTTGGDGADACSGDLLVQCSTFCAPPCSAFAALARREVLASSLQALAACAGVTLRSVATAMRVDLRDVVVNVDGTFDARGTLGVDRAVPVGLTSMDLTFTFDTDADHATVAKLLELTERHCVVAQTVAGTIRPVIRRG